MDVIVLVIFLSKVQDYLSHVDQHISELT
jgi:hypothetical protein